MSRNKSLRLERYKLERYLPSREQIRDAIAVGICDKLDPENDVLKICFSRKQLRQLFKSSMFVSHLGKRCYINPYWSKEKNDNLFVCRFCDLRTVHYKMFEKAFGEEGFENYKEFMLKIYKSNWTKKEDRLWCEEEELNSSFVYLYNLYGEVRKWVNSTAFAIKLELNTTEKVKVKGQPGLYKYYKK